MKHDAFIGLLIFVFVMALVGFKVASEGRRPDPQAIVTPG